MLNMQDWLKSLEAAEEASGSVDKSKGSKIEQEDQDQQEEEEVDMTEPLLPSVVPLPLALAAPKLPVQQIPIVNKSIKKTKSKPNSSTSSLRIDCISLSKYNSTTTSTNTNKKYSAGARAAAVKVPRDNNGRFLPAARRLPSTSAAGTSKDTSTSEAESEGKLSFWSFAKKTSRQHCYTQAQKRAKYDPTSDEEVQVVEVEMPRSMEESMEIIDVHDSDSEQTETETISIINGDDIAENELVRFDPPNSNKKAASSIISTSSSGSLGSKEHNLTNARVRLERFGPSNFGSKQDNDEFMAANNLRDDEARLTSGSDGNSKAPKQQPQLQMKSAASTDKDEDTAAVSVGVGVGLGLGHLGRGGPLRFDSQEEHDEFFRLEKLFTLHPKRFKQRPVSPVHTMYEERHLIVRPSGVDGLGLFSQNFIKSGEIVIEYAGESITKGLAVRRQIWYEYQHKHNYIMCIDGKADKYIDATYTGNCARFMNHSCDPNCASQAVQIRGKEHVMMHALRDISPGEELTFDYDFISPELIPCNCGTKKCRKFMNKMAKQLKLKAKDTKLILEELKSSSSSTTWSSSASSTSGNE